MTSLSECLATWDRFPTLRLDHYSARLDHYSARLDHYSLRLDHYFC